MPKVIQIAGQDIGFRGGEADAYFKDLAVFVAENGQLVRFLKSLPVDAVSLDIGANIGVTPITIALMIPGGFVYAFEPGPTNVEYLRQNISHNGFQNIEVIPAAVGAVKGVTKFHMAQTGAHSTVIRNPVGPSPDVVEVEQLSIDDWASVRSLKRLDFMKIDVEGYERYVLLGAAETIAKWRMPILMEFNSITIAFEDRMSPWVFAETLARIFDIFSVEEDGTAVPACGGDIRRFAFVNMTEHGHVDDVILRLKSDKGADDIRQALGSVIEPAASSKPASRWASLRSKFGA